MPLDVTLLSRPGPLGEVSSARRFGVRAWVSDRRGGVSASCYSTFNLAEHVGDDPADVAANRAILAHAVGVEPSRLLFVRQVHGVDVVAASAVGPDTEADAILGGDFAVAVLVADCVPVLIVNRQTSEFAVVHAGWRGLAAGVIARAASRLGEGDSLYAYVGPSISGAAYQVGPEVAASFSGVPGALVPDVADRSRLDLRAVSVHQLQALGLRDEFIEKSVEVTDGGGRFFSDRAQRPSGRFALVAKRAS
ncbi:MAG TPA: polyphenol oxidase family protein [Acidimicrobiales bacterium]|nr:polyphenol oxidase family protein [Acidimicrobiales bacterium]